MKDMISLLYGSKTGRFIINASLKAGLAKLMAAYLRSPLSLPMIGQYIRKYGISTEDCEKIKYRCFADFFSRKKISWKVDEDPSHLISPCDGWLSTYRIDEESSFSIKGSQYRICDLVDDENVASKFMGGKCLIFRLTPSDYHRFVYMDRGSLVKSRFIEGQLHSVQPIVCEHFPVYRLNRRFWSLMEMEDLGDVVQIEVGAMAVGGIVHHLKEGFFKKGEEMGLFELCGSTIVVLVQKDKVKLLPEIEKLEESGKEFQVRLGGYIGDIQQ